MGNVFFERFAELCKAIGETPNSVAKRLGISSGSVTAWKNGTEPRYSTVTKIADYLGTSADYLLGNVSDSAPKPNRITDLFRGVGSYPISPDYDIHIVPKGEKAPAEPGKRSVSDDDIKFALFGGDGEITDAMYDEVRRFAAFVKQREAEKKKE